MYKYSPTLENLMFLCESYITEANENNGKNASEKIYNYCSSYCLNVETTKEKNELIKFFKIQL